MAGTARAPSCCAAGPVTASGTGDRRRRQAMRVAHGLIVAIDTVSTSFNATSKLALESA
jgi:hypothetical protein